MTLQLQWQGRTCCFLDPRPSLCVFQRRFQYQRQHVMSLRELTHAHKHELPRTPQASHKGTEHDCVTQGLLYVFSRGIISVTGSMWCLLGY